MYWSCPYKVGIVVLLNFDPLAHTSIAVCSTKCEVKWQNAIRNTANELSSVCGSAQSMWHLLLHKGLWVRIATWLTYCKSWTDTVWHLVLFCFCFFAVLHLTNYVLGHATSFSGVLHSMVAWVLERTVCVFVSLSINILCFIFRFIIKNTHCMCWSRYTVVW